MELWMESSQMTDSVLISICNISVWQVFSLWRNNLSGILPREICNLIKMQFLYLEKNRFTGGIHKEMSNLIESEVHDCYDTNRGPSRDEHLEPQRPGRPCLSGGIPYNFTAFTEYLISVAAKIGVLLREEHTRSHSRVPQPKSIHYVVVGLMITKQGSKR
ncbi:uncharacterized protein LOC124897645 [Capsicum annuum]|uniref:uncharacterized protein LOC124897645 n=1 Tax=Capsicum annuum TaxID=4072 RepID=UPI001FB07D0B|nr:uncharacterized protein LOC124897645 [Capsicum annuum]